jgi:hypothetical protein
LIGAGFVGQAIACLKWIKSLPFDPTRCQWCFYQLEGLGDMPVRCPECGHAPRTSHQVAPLAESLVVLPALVLTGLASLFVLILALVTLIN